MVRETLSSFVTCCKLAGSVQFRRCKGWKVDVRLREADLVICFFWYLDMLSLSLDSRGFSFRRVLGPLWILHDDEEAATRFRSTVE
jgi:hypothetical protein